MLTLDLIHHLAEELNQDPEIVLKESCTIIGFETTVPSPFIYHEGYCDLLYPSWKKLFERQGEIKSRIPGVHYGLSISNSGDFTEDTIDYMAGVPVTTVPEIPFGMVSYLIPEQLVAIFDVSVVEKDTAFNTIDYIYGYWLPNSPYQRGQGNDYEYFENIRDERDSDFTSKYVIPIVPK